MKSVIIYLFILFTSLFLARLSLIVKKSIRKYFAIALVLFFSLIVGLRWDVGVDYMSYYDFAVGNYLYDYQLERLELVPRLLAEITTAKILPFYCWFIIMAFFQIYFIDRFLRTVSPELLVWGIFFFITSFLHEQLNIVRQGAAMCIVLYAFTFIIHRKPINYVGSVILASCFHLSALICLPFYFLKNKQIPSSLLWQYSVFFIFSFLSKPIVWALLGGFAYIGSSLGYGLAMEILMKDIWQVENSSGFGIIFYYFRYIVLIYYSPMLFRCFNRIGFKFFYMLHFTFMCLYSACFSSMSLQRLFAYFNYSSIIVFSCLVYYLLNIKKTYFSISLALLLIAIQLVLYINGAEPWQFI